MRDDQRARLAALEEQLIDKVLDEADPETWPGAGVELAQMTKQERGDAYWCKQNAAATLGLAMRVASLIQNADRAKWADPNKPTADDEAERMEGEIAKYEKKAKAMLETVMERHGGGKRPR